VHDVVADFIRSRCRASLPGGVLRHDQPLFSTGVIDSFGVLELIAFLEQQFGVEIDPARHEIEEFDSVARMASLVAALKAGA